METQEHFFQVIADRGIRDGRVAREMEITKEHFSRVKRGEKPITPKFRRRATEAFVRLGVRDDRGVVYTEDRLFSRASSFTNVNESGTEVIGAA